MNSTPSFSAQFPIQPNTPPLLQNLDGSAVLSPEDWFNRRRPELLRLIQWCEYGFLPPAPENLTAALLYENTAAFAGKAWLRELELTWGLPDFSIRLLLVTPAGAKHSPVFAGLNFSGNHGLVPDEGVSRPSDSMDQNGRPLRSGEVERNGRADAWQIEACIDRGYGVATFHPGTLIPDKLEQAERRLERFRDFHCPEVPKASACGALAVWAWGLQRVLDYLTTDPAVDPGRVASVGHSRMGKTAILAAATDPRFALAIPSQAGCGGTAPARVGPTPDDKPAETLKAILHTFPYWFCENFRSFASDPARLPYDHDALLALCAPRPVMVSNASDDHWAYPEGQFLMTQSADQVYRLLDQPALELEQMPAVHEYTLGKLGYFLREGKHAMGLDEWQVWWQFAGRWL